MYSGLPFKFDAPCDEIGNVILQRITYFAFLFLQWLKFHTVPHYKARLVTRSNYNLDLFHFTRDFEGVHIVFVKV